MASTPVPVPPSPALDGPPPSPANPPGAPGYGGVPGIPPVPGGPEAGAPDTAAKQLVSMGADIDRAILAMAQAAPGDIPEFAEARKLMQAGVAKLIAGAAGGGLGAASGATGAQFPGGGMSSGIPF
jgi:hypothetical protein